MSAPPIDALRTASTAAAIDALLCRFFGSTRACPVPVAVIVWTVEVDVGSCRPGTGRP
jgi:hypothetical protein